jgi:hypothetical protein
MSDILKPHGHHASLDPLDWRDGDESAANGPAWIFVPYSESSRASELKPGKSEALSQALSAAVAKAGPASGAASTESALTGNAITNGDGNTGGTTDPNSQIALGADIASALYGLTGTGLKIGIISDSYNNTGNGYLPSNVTVVSDLASGGSDEGRAMIELAQKIAPGATFYFATGYSNPGVTTPAIQTCANAVASLVSQGCNIIIDDLGFGTAEAFYQVGTVLDNAISAAVASGVDYFSAAGNDGKAYYEQGFTALSASFANINGGTAVTVNNFGGATPSSLSLTIAVGGTITPLFEWAQPFKSIGSSSAGAQNSLAIYLLDSTGNVVASSVGNQVGFDPTQSFSFTNNTTDTSFQLVVVQNGGSVPNGQLFKVVFSSGGVTINNANANQGSGNVYGHELVTAQNSVGAVNYAQTPAFGVSPPTPTSFTSVGTGTILFDTQGNPITATSAAEPDFSGAQGSSTGVPGFQPFNGTSAAAPNVGAVSALVLQAYGSLGTTGTLSTTQITSILTQSAIPESTTLADSGAGLVQARAAVEIGANDKGARWSNSAGGNWTTAASWTGSAVPTSGAGAIISDNLGAITGVYNYTVTVNSGGNVAGSLAISALTGSRAGLVIANGGSLSIGGATTNNVTANDFLVSNNGLLNVAGGQVSVAGTLNVNNGTVTDGIGAVTAGSYAQNAGLIVVGGGGGATFTLTGAGFAQTGGAVSIQAQGALATTTLSDTASTFAIVSATGTVQATTASFSDAVLTDAGSFTAASSLVLVDSQASIASGGSTSVGSLTLRNLVVGATATLAVAGTLTDAGAFSNGGSNAGGTLIVQNTGVASIGGTTDSESIVFGGAGTLKFTSSNSTLLTSQLISTISSFNLAGGTIDFTGLAYASGDSYSYASGNGQLNVLDPNSNVLASLLLNAPDNYTTFRVFQDSATGIDVVAACYCAGTLITTERGEIPVESLASGDLVVTASGRLVPVRWMGWRRVDFRRHPEPAHVKPIRIAAGAFGGALPRRDLWVSPEHAVFIDGVLVPARHLVGCPGVTVDLSIETTTYYHVELPRHDVILAEGLPCESWLDTGNRAMFENAGVATLHFSDERGVAERWAADACAPLLTDGPALDELRHRLGAERTQDVRLDRTGAHDVVVPAGPGLLRLLSDARQPSGEARALGVAIATICCDGEAIGLCDARLDRGFYSAEAAWRWTDGGAHLFLGESDKPRVVRFQVCMVARPTALAA